MFVCLIVGFLFQPASGIATQVETSGFIIDEDGQHEWNGWEPPNESVKQ